MLRIDPRGIPFSISKDCNKILLDRTFMRRVLNISMKIKMFPVNPKDIKQLVNIFYIPCRCLFNATNGLATLIPGLDINPLHMLDFVLTK